MTQSTPPPAKTATLDHETRLAGEAFLRRIGGNYAIVEALVFGSRARGDHREESDADLAVILEGAPGNRWSAAVHMAGIAFDVMMETGILVEPLPLWEAEFRNPESFSSPDLIRTIRLEGVRL